MKRLFLLIVVSLLFASIALVSWTSPAHGLTRYLRNKCAQVEQQLAICNDELAACMDELEGCDADGGQIFPGDGYSDPSFGTIGHGPALSYTDNGDGTFTDDNTGDMWEIKDDSGGVHDVDNTYTWTSTGTAADGTLFTAFLDTLNNKCDGNETTPCTSDGECSGIGNGLCGHAGYRDWCIPNAKKLQSIVDYSTFEPATSFPGLTANWEYWSSTTLDSNQVGGWFVNFSNGIVNAFDKLNPIRARAVRPCP